MYFTWIRSTLHTEKKVRKGNKGHAHDDLYVGTGNDYTCLILDDSSERLCIVLFRLGGSSLSTIVVLLLDRCLVIEAKWKMNSKMESGTSKWLERVLQPNCGDVVRLEWDQNSGKMFQLWASEQRL